MNLVELHNIIMRQYQINYQIHNKNYLIIIIH
jgi:hypothetical protein